MDRIFVALLWVMLSPATWAEVGPQDTEQLRAHIEKSLIDAYRGDPQIIEHVEMLARDGSEQPIRISHHKNLSPQDKILLLVLDDGSRGLVGENDDVVVVGLPFADRIKDLTPFLGAELANNQTESNTPKSPEQLNHEVTTPNSDGLVAFIKTTLLPHLKRQYGPFNQRVLFGYSFGGIFTIQTLMQEPGLFNAYIAGSPSLWYHYPYYETLAIDARKRTGEFKNRCLVMSAAEDEPTINANARRFQQLLVGLDLPLLLDYQRNIEIDHSHNRAISFAYGWDRIFNLDDAFPSPAAIPTSKLTDFHLFYRDWLGQKSCMPYNKARSVEAYIAFANKMVKQNDWQTFESIYDHFDDLDRQSVAFGTLFLGMVNHFKNMPAPLKATWAPRYQAFMDRGPRPYLAVHFINLDIVAYLKQTQR